MSQLHVLILAGGGGTRLWPLSRQDFPKQFLHFGDQQSLLQKSVSLFLHSNVTQSISIATNAQYAPLVKEQLEKIDPENKIQVIVEPLRKNTGPAIAFAIKYLQTELHLSANDSLLILPSDHLIEPKGLFLTFLTEIEPIIGQGHLLLFGIQPTKPETGYGYIQIGEKQTLWAHQVKKFVEKPDLSLAKHYASSGDYLWNSGIFALSIGTFWQKLSHHAPDIDKLMQGTLQEIIAHFDQMPNISFDYAILEKCREILVCPLPVNWSDIGCWDSVYEVMDKDINQNVKYGNIVDIDTKNSLIIGGKRLISTIGLEDILIVETDDATFISKKGESQKVKAMVQQLIKIGKKEGENHASHDYSWGTLQLLDETKTSIIQKIKIYPGKTWESATPISGKWIPVDTSCTLEINDCLQELTSSNIYHCVFKIKNPTDRVATLLLLKDISV